MGAFRADFRRYWRFGSFCGVRLRRSTKLPAASLPSRGSTSSFYRFAFDWRPQRRSAFSRPRLRHQGLNVFPQLRYFGRGPALVWKVGRDLLEAAPPPTPTVRAVAQIVSEPSEPGGYREGEWQDIDLLGCIFPEGG